MRILFCTAVVLAGLAVSRADAQQAPCWGYASQGTVWYASAPGTGPITSGGIVTTMPVYGSPVVTSTYPAYYSVPQYSYRYPQWSYGYPATESYSSYAGRYAWTPTYRATPYRTGLRRDYEENYDPRIPGGPNH